MGLLMQEILNGVGTFDARMGIFIHSSPMLRDNYPILHDSGPTPPPCYPWTHPHDHIQLNPHACGTI
jgi:hypothetical protein